ncbi:arrestin domain-containing protein 3-like [Pollicipes pollicipes]|uniref:arrestin domain-containing protein 3-like n=1 Tax=Pollicipes pollicipes TaxID=41117 RepID=UPI001885734C|nr:arrestin domain-containing protein 3-like [Pollicipes pollicipes]
MPPPLELELHVLLDAPSGVHLPGSELSGRVVVATPQPLAVASVEVRCRGEVVVAFEDSQRAVRTWVRGARLADRSSRRSSPSLGSERSAGRGPARLEAAEMLLDQQRCLLGDPSPLPPAFSGRHGFVRYTVSAVLRRQQPLPQLSRVAAFSVVPELDVNLASDVLRPRRSHSSRHLCGFCCRTGPLTVSVEVSRRGFAPGQVIPVSAEAMNISGRTMASTSLSLLQLVTYSSSGSSSSRLLDRRLVSRDERGPLPPGEAETFARLQFLVPPLPPTFACRLLDVRYAVERNSTYTHASGDPRNMEQDGSRQQTLANRIQPICDKDEWLPFYPVFREPGPVQPRRPSARFAELPHVTG